MRVMWKVCHLLSIDIMCLTLIIYYMFFSELFGNASDISSSNEDDDGQANDTRVSLI